MFAEGIFLGSPLQPRDLRKENDGTPSDNAELIKNIENGMPL